MNVSYRCLAAVTLRSVSLSTTFSLAAHSGSPLACPASICWLYLTASRPRRSCRWMLSFSSTKSTTTRNRGRGNESCSGVWSYSPCRCASRSYSRCSSSTCARVRGKPSTRAPARYRSSISVSHSTWNTSRSPTRPPSSLTFCAAGELSRSLMTIGGAEMPRSARTNGVHVPLPEPGAPPSHSSSCGKWMPWSPPILSCSRDHTTSKMT
mmetsp:Transcript_13551/g.47236  ORF Transcript_13551/g.47236 Transcript_13551/m.47236 type:complete len:209 (+) Transcript_13551:485-1111(+)